MIDSNGIKTTVGLYNVFYWMKINNFQESYWLRPFICAAAISKVGSTPIRPGIMSMMLPFNSQDLTSLSNNNLTLHGLSAIMANVVHFHTLDLKFKQYKSPENELDVLEWHLDLPKMDLQLEFSFLKESDWGESFESDLIKLRITFNRLSDNEQQSKCIAQLTVLRVDLNFRTDEVLALPQGYSCRRNVEVPVELSPFVTAPLKFKGLRPKYTFEITTITDQDRSSEPASYTYNGHHFTMPDLIDSMNKPTSESRTVTIMEDELDKTLTIVAPIRDDSLKRSSLSVYDSNSMRRQVVHNLADGHCEDPVGFRSTLFNRQARTETTTLSTPTTTAATTKTTTAKSFDGYDSGEDSTPVDKARLATVSARTCSIEGVELELDSDLTLRINEYGLKLLQFTMQDRKNRAQLINYIPASGNDLAEDLLVYEMSANDKFCIYTNKGKDLLPVSAVKLVTKYAIKRELDSKQAIKYFVEPKSSQLLFVNEYSSKLLLKIDFNLLHFEDYKPWSQSKHLLSDLLKCKLAQPKQSARLKIEYPLTKDSSHLRKFEEPHRLIREAVASHMRITYSLSATRIAGIEVAIEDDLVQIELQLLDQEHILDDSELMPFIQLKDLSKMDYLHWLKQSHRSVLLSSLQACAEYCQHYRCEVYVYCNYSSSCYIYSSLSSLNSIRSNFGSYKSNDMYCAAYKVQASRFDSANIWRKNSWSLEELLDSLVSAVNRPMKSTYTNIGRDDDDMTETAAAKEAATKEKDPVELLLTNPHRLSVMKPNLEIWSKLFGEEYSLRVRLFASYASYKYDNLHFGNMLVSEPNPFMFDKPDDKQQQDLKLLNFRVSLSGYEYVETKTQSQFNLDHDNMHLDLDDSDGYLILENHSLEECLKICLSDLKCSSFSFCIDSVHPAYCVISKINQRGLDTLLDSLLNGVPIEDTYQSMGDIDEDKRQVIHHLTIKANEKCSVMMRTYSDQFERLEYKMLVDTKDYPMSKVLSIFVASNAEQCADNCIKQRVEQIAAGESADEDLDLANACMSYDFCKPYSSLDRMSPSACVLYKEHLVSSSSHREHVKHDFPAQKDATLKGETKPETGKDLLAALQDELKISIHSFCWHFVRNFLADFHKLNHRQLPNDMKTLILRNFEPAQKQRESTVTSGDISVIGDNIDLTRGEDISLVNCAKLCEEDPNCGAFEYCIANYKEAPSGLYLGCSLGNNETLELSPTTSIIQKRHQQTDMLKLGKSQICSVYVYKSLSLILGHKKKNLVKLGEDIIKEAEHESAVAFFRLIRLDVIMLFFFLVFGFLVRDIDLNQFKFRKLEPTEDAIESNGNQQATLRTSASQSSVADMPASSSDTFKLRTISNKLIQRQ